MTALHIAPMPPNAVAFDRRRTGSISHISAAEITARLGVQPERDSVLGITDHEWTFVADGHPCAIWDYRGSGRNRVWSTSGPAEVFAGLFGWRAAL